MNTGLDQLVRAMEISDEWYALDQIHAIPILDNDPASDTSSDVSEYDFQPWKPRQTPERFGLTPLDTFREMEMDLSGSTLCITNIDAHSDAFRRALQSCLEEFTNLTNELRIYICKVRLTACVNLCGIFSARQLKLDVLRIDESTIHPKPFSQLMKESTGRIRSLTLSSMPDVTYVHCSALARFMYESAGRGFEEVDLRWVTFLPQVTTGIIRSSLEAFLDVLPLRSEPLPTKLTVKWIQCEVMHPTTCSKRARTRLNKVCSKVLTRIFRTFGIQSLSYRTPKSKNRHEVAHMSQALANTKTLGIKSYLPRQPCIWRIDSREKKPSTRRSRSRKGFSFRSYASTPSTYPNLSLSGRLFHYAGSVWTVDT